MSIPDTPIIPMPNIHTRQHAPARKQANAAGEKPAINARLRELRLAAGLTQEALGAQGFVSTPGWIKVEYGQRRPSEKLLEALATFLVEEKVIAARQKDALFQELCALKYAAHRGPFLARLAKDYLKTLMQVGVTCIHFR